MSTSILSRKRPFSELTNHTNSNHQPTKKLLNSKLKPIPTAGYSSTPTSSSSSNSNSSTTTTTTTTADHHAGPEINRMRVFVRVRPESEKETSNPNVKPVVDVTSSQMLVFDPKEEGNDGYFYKGQVFKEIGRKVNKNLSFCFDKVFDDNATNYDVYHHATKSLVSSLLDGYNCTVFAYGATGSGKTHTMIGNPEEPGVIFYTTVEIFERIKDLEKDGLEISVSYIEIYNEQVYDLLSPSLGKSLAVRDDPKRGVIVANLSVHYPEDAKHLINMIEFGNNNRAKQATDANHQSSRSHAIFQLYLKKQDFNNNQQMCVQLAKMSLIDLAGSERASVAYKEKRNKDLQREGSNINKSLLSLGNCINALARQSKKKGTGYIPYRDSKLTLLLRDSLGGNCHTAMIAAISPTSLCFEDTHNTLTYAQRAKGIQFDINKKTVTTSIEPRHYAQALEVANRRNTELEVEILALKQELEKVKSEMTSVPNDPISFGQGSLDILNRFKNTLSRLFDERRQLRKQFLECQSNIKLTNLKIMFKKMDLKRLRILENNGRNLITDDDFTSTHAKLQSDINRLDALQQEIDVNEAQLLQLEKELREQVEDDDFIVNTYFDSQHLECEFKDKNLANAHANKVFAEFLKRFENNEELLLDFMHLNHYVRTFLLGINRLSDGLQAKFDTLKKKLEGKKQLVWRDQPNEKKRISIINEHQISDVFKLDIYEARPKTPAKPDNPHLVSIYSVTPF